MRTYIKEIRINNYKTYKNARIKFHPQLNIIVGPNGSGKSNLIEAILYGLGERSMKVFRAYKYKDLLPADSRNSAKTLSVTIIIEDQNGDEHIFKRIYNANNNTHAYYYNRKRVSRGVYISKLATLGYRGLHHVYIPQGGIISKANITSRDLKDIVDDALGIKEFNIKKQEALEKLEKAEAKLENIKEKQEIMKEVIYTLMAQMISYDRKNNLDKISRRIKGYLIVNENKKIRPKLTKYTKKINELENIKEKLNKRMEKIEEKITKIDAKMGKLREKLKGREEYQQLLKEYSDVNINITTTQDKIKRLTDDKERYLDEISQIDKDLENIKLEVATYAATLKELNQANRRNQTELNSLYKEKEKLENKINKLREELDQIIEKKEKLEEEKENILKTHIKEEAEIIAIEKIKDLYIDKKKQLEDKRRKYLDTIKKFEERIEKLSQMKTELDNKLKKLRKEKEKKDNRYRELKREIRDAEKLLNKVERYIEKLRKEEEIRNIEFKNNAEYVLKIAKDMNLKGVLGILSNFINGPKEIINILRRYLGREWYSIIVYDEATAKKLFKLSESIKKKVVIKPITKYMSNEEKIHERSVINILKIKNYRKLKPLVNSLFGDLIITSDLEEGIKLLDEGHGIISRKGEFIITPDNWIYEGRKRMVIDEDISKIEEIYHQFKRMIDLRREDLDKLNEEREKLIDDITEATSEYTRLKQSIELIKTSIGYMKDLEKFYRNKVKEIEKDLSKEKNRRKIDKTPLDEIRTIENKINTIYKKMADYTNEITEINTKINNINNLISKNNANIELIKKSILSTKEKKARLKKRRSEVKTRIKNIDREINNLKNTLKILERNKKESESQLNKFNEEIKAIEDKLEKLNSLKNQLYGKWKKANEKLSDLKEIETRLTYKIKTLKTRLIHNEDTILKLGYTIEELSNKETNIETLELLQQEVDEELKSFEKEAHYPSPTAYIEYREKYEPYKLFTINRAKLEEEKEAILDFIREIEMEKERTFREGFTKIKEKFTRLINHVFPDSEVYIELEDPEDIDSGLAVYVKLRDKPQLPVISASGGEKSLFIILFLLSVYSIPGNVVFLLDEIDAHIDPRNLNKFASALELQKTESQIIYVTLPRDEALPRISDHLIGIFFRRGVSRPVVIPNTELFRVVK